MDPNFDRKVRVLIVDDVAVHRYLLRGGLERINPFWDFHEAGSGEQAKQMLASELPYDVVVCDWMMPDVSGADLLAWMRSLVRLRKVPFIMVSSKGDQEDIIEAFMQLKVDGYAVKPFSPQDIYQKILAVLG